MKWLSEFCVKVKMVAVELVSLVGFLGILGVGLYWEWNRLLRSCIDKQSGLKSEGTDQVNAFG